jgi:oxygen-independent coproporphyrinogen III oxidase
VAGIYIHIPFCKQKCTYCDFHFSTTFEGYRNEMIQAMCAEMRLRGADFLNNVPLETIYFGGGTPSLLHEDELNSLLDTVREEFDCTQVREITLEANPDDLSDEQLAVWKKLGVNRLSIGIQSFRAQDLEWMNRAHTVEEALEAVSRAQAAGFENLTVDLMYGLPELDDEQWLAHLNTVVESGVPHISAYCLTVEQKTRLHHLVEKGKLKVASEDEQARQFELMVNLLTNSGYEHYEISNFAKPGMHAVHNSNYWLNRKYLGIGPSAHSYDGERRYWNVANNSAYIKSLQASQLPAEVEILTPENRFNESLLTGLRTKWGVSLDELSAILPVRDSFHTTLESFLQAGDLELCDERIVLTPQGRLKADFIASELFYV